MSKETQGFTDFMDGYKNYRPINDPNDPNPLIDFLKQFWWFIPIALLIFYFLY